MRLKRGWEASSRGTDDHLHIGVGRTSRQLEGAVGGLSRAVDRAERRNLGECSNAFCIFRFVR